MRVDLRCWWGTLLGLVGVFLLGLVIIGAHWLPVGALRSSWGTLGALLPPLASLAVELAVVGGIPLGFAIGLELKGASLRRSLRRLYIPCALALGGLLLARHIDVSDQSPGIVVTRLVEAARAGCAGRDEVTLPVANLRVDCRRDRVAGKTTFLSATFSARDFAPNADLSRLSFKDFELAVPARSNVPRVSLRAGAAELRGLSPWGRSRKVSPFVRVLGAWLAVALTALLLVVLGKPSARSAQVVMGVAAGAALMFGLIQLDRSSQSAGFAIALPVVGAVGAVLGAIGWGLGKAVISWVHARTERRRRTIARG